MASINPNIPTRTNTILTTTNSPINTNSTTAVQSAGSQAASSGTNPSTSLTVSAVVPSVTAAVPTEQSVMYTAKAPGTGKVGTPNVCGSMDPSELMFQAEKKALDIIADMKVSIAERIDKIRCMLTTSVNQHDENDAFGSAKNHFETETNMACGSVDLFKGVVLEYPITYNKFGIKYETTLKLSNVEVSAGSNGNFLVTFDTSLSPQIPSSMELARQIFAQSKMPIGGLDFGPIPTPTLPAQIPYLPTSS